MKLFFDTETTGKADFRDTRPEKQPYIVQLGALLTDDEGNECASLDVIIRPSGWTIPEDTAAIHGITTEKADMCGIPIACALMVFGNLLDRADTLIAHNISFDHLVTLSEYERLYQKMSAAKVGHARLMNTARFCTMNATTDICKLPGNYGKYKWPKLTEAHKHLFGEDVIGAHDAMTDVRACKRIYFELLKNAAPQDRQP